MATGGETASKQEGGASLPDGAVTLTPAAGRRRREANAVPLIAVLGGATATALWGCGLLRGGWLGVDVALTAVGVMLARPSARPRGFRAWRGADRRSPVLRLAAGVAITALALIALGLWLGRIPADSGVRGDLLAAGLQFANLRGAGGAPHALDPWTGAPTSQLWLASLLAQVAAVVVIARLVVRRPGVRQQTDRSLAVFVIAGALVTAAWGRANDWTAQAIVLLPWFRGLGVAFGFVVARAVRRPDQMLVRFWPVPLAVLAGLAAASSANDVRAPLAVAGAVAATTWLLLVRPAVLVAVERRGPWLCWTAGVAFVAGPALAALAAGGSTSTAARATGLVVAVGGALLLGWAARTLDGAVPTGEITRVVVPPICVGLLAVSLALAGFFHAPAPTVVDAERHEQPTGLLAAALLVDPLPAPPEFCTSEAVGELGDHLGAMLVSVVDEDRATPLLADTAPDWDQLLATAPDPTIRADITVVRDQEDALRTALSRVGPAIDTSDFDVLRKVIERDPQILSLLRLTFYLERRCSLIVSS